jgi:CRP/FNR family transcriptional regulator
MACSRGGSVLQHGGRSPQAAFAQASIFHGVNRGELQELVDVSERALYRRGEVMLEPTEEDGIFLVAEGAVRMYRISHDGRELTVAVLREGDLFGLVFVQAEIQSKVKSYFETVEAKTVVYYIPRSAFQRFVAHHPEVALRTVGLLNMRLDTAYDRMEDFALYKVKHRLARTLARLALRNDERAVTMSKENLAKLAGTTREEVSRALGKLGAEGLIQTQKRTIIVPDPETLAPDLFIFS